MLDAFGAQVDLPLGLEFGMAHLFPEAAETILRQPGLDFVIGSCHNQDEKAGGTDFYLLPYDTLDQCYEALDNYFASIFADGGLPVLRCGGPRHLSPAVHERPLRHPGPGAVPGPDPGDPPASHRLRPGHGDQHLEGPDPGPVDPPSSRTTRSWGARSSPWVPMPTPPAPWARGSRKPIP